MVALGYYLDRWILVPLFAVQMLLYLSQTLAENSHGRVEPAWTIKWTTHRLGPFASLLMVIDCVDSNQVFGIWNRTNGGATWPLANCLLIALVLSYSSCYSVMLCNYVILRKLPPRRLAYLYILPAAFAVSVTNTIVIYSMATETNPYSGVYCILIGLCFIYGQCAFHIAAYPLIKMLRDTHETANSFKFQGSEMSATKKSLKTLTRFRTVSTVMVAVACALLFAFATHLQAEDIENTEVYQPGLGMGIAVIWLGLNVSLWFSWEKPASRESSRNVPNSPGPAPGVAVGTGTLTRSPANGYAHHQRYDSATTTFLDGGSLPPSAAATPSRRCPGLAAATLTPPSIAAVTTTMSTVTTTGAALTIVSACGDDTLESQPEAQPLIGDALMIGSSSVASPVTSPMSAGVSLDALRSSVSVVMSPSIGGTTVIADDATASQPADAVRFHYSDGDRLRGGLTGDEDDDEVVFIRRTISPPCPAEDVA